MKGIISKNKGEYIGLNGELPWKSIEDLKHFKNMTNNCTLLVGYNTAKNLPALPNRKVIVDSNDTVINVDEIDWCIGGKKTYEKYCHLFTELHVSIIVNDLTIGDTLYPDLTNLNPECKVYYYYYESIVRLDNIKNVYVKKFRKEEKSFGDLMSSRGEVKQSNKSEDMFEHWDISVNDIKYDVKSMKTKIRTNDSEPNEQYHWIEFQNVNGNLGWLYASQAVYLAFETIDYWVIVDKIKLQKFVENKCKDQIKATMPSLYKLYSRDGNEDILTLVKTIDLMALSEEIISKC